MNILPLLDPTIRDPHSGERVDTDEDMQLVRAAVLELLAADRALDAAEEAQRLAPYIADPVTPADWMADSANRDAREAVRDARKRRAAALACFEGTPA